MVLIGKSPVNNWEITNDSPKKKLDLIIDKAQAIEIIKKYKLSLLNDIYHFSFNEMFWSDSFTFNKKK